MQRMANLTLSIDDDLLRAARVRAVQEGTSVNEICRQAIERYARPDTPEERVRRFDEMMARLQAMVKNEPRSGPAWPGREALYEETLGPRLKWPRK